MFERTWTEPVLMHSLPGWEEIVEGKARLQACMGEKFQDITLIQQKGVTAQELMATVRSYLQEIEEVAVENVQLTPLEL